MSDYIEDNYNKFRSGWDGWHPSIRAALIFTIPFIIVDFSNYYSAGAALAISCPILFIIYGACGAMAGKYGSEEGYTSSSPMVLGAMAGAGLWTISTLVNTLIGLVFGTLSLGVTLFLGVPYLFCIAPIMLLFGSVTGLLGAVLYKFIFTRDSSSDDNSYS